MPEYFVLLRVAYMCNALDAKIAELELVTQYACYCFEGDFCANTLACVDLDLFGVPDALLIRSCALNSADNTCFLSVLSQLSFSLLHEVRLPLLEVFR